MDRSRNLNPVLVAGDAVVFLVFALAGLRSHDEDPALATLLRVIVPFLGSWLVVAYPTGLLGRDGSDLSPDRAWRRVLGAWLPAWALGLLLRTLVFGRSFAPTFALIALLTNAILLIGWRSAYAYARRRQPSH